MDNKISYIVSIVVVLVLYSCSKTSYWHSVDYSSSGHSPEEIHINDSSFTKFGYLGTGCLPQNSGFGEMRKSVIKGDTILIYDYRVIYPKGDTINYKYKLCLYEAYLKQNNKLYFIYDHYPMSWWPTTDSDTNDSSMITKTGVNWEGWTTDEAYIDFDGYYYKKGKNRYLRKLMKHNFKSNDSTNWHLSLPNSLLNDTTITRSSVQDKLGPLKD